MVDLVKAPVWIRRDESLGALARRSVGQIDDRLVKVDDGNDVPAADLLQVVRHSQSSLPFASRSATTLVVAGTRQHSSQVDELLGVHILLLRAPEHLSLFADAEHEHVVVPLFDGSHGLQQARSRRAIRRCGSSGAGRSAAGCLDDGRRYAWALALTTSGSSRRCEGLNVARLPVCPHNAVSGVLPRAA